MSAGDVKHLLGRLERLRSLCSEATLAIFDADPVDRADPVLPNCGTCRHWRRHCEHRNVVGPEGQCWKVYDFDSDRTDPVTCRPGVTGVCARGEMGEHAHPADEESLMWGQDGSDFRADVYTREGFSCPMFEAVDPPEPVAP